MVYRAAFAPGTFVYDSEGNLIEDRSKSLKSPMIGSMDYFGARYLDPMLGL
ncbi:MAG: hypothetical protein MJZ10_02820 [Fibrobacter sp.]|nr:hypothetical protein [Fibrobacter sp.]